jgi:predicted metal-dependent hydrolase
MDMSLKPYKIFRSNRKTVFIGFNQYGDLIVKAPKSLPVSKIYDLIERHKDALNKKRRDVLSSRLRSKKHLFQEGEEFWFLGRTLKLKFVDDVDLFSIRRGISTTEKNLLLPERYRNFAKKEIEKFYRKEAKKFFTSRVHFYIVKYFEVFGERLNYTNLKISSGQRTVGSCSPKNSLSFSWRLIQAPIQIIDYVVAHEIVHIKEKHHQKAFWDKVRMLDPDYKRNLKWLKENWFYLREFLIYD